MIYDSLANLVKYKGLHPNLDKAFDYLMTNDLTALPEGRTDIAGKDGSDIYINKSESSTRVDGQFEYHKTYADVQIDLLGSEEIQVAEKPGGDCEPFNMENDCGFVRAESEACCWLQPGSFALLLPGELHKPLMAVDGQVMPVLKCVVKVKL